MQRLYSSPSRSYEMSTDFFLVLTLDVEQCCTFAFFKNIRDVLLACWSYATYAIWRRNFMAHTIILRVRLGPQLYISVLPQLDSAFQAESGRMRSCSNALWVLWNISKAISRSLCIILCSTWRWYLVLSNVTNITQSVSIYFCLGNIFV